MSLSAIVLAAGHGRRFGGDKLLRRYRDAPLFMHAVRAACAAPVERIVIVKQPGAEMERYCRAAIAADVRVGAVEVKSDALSQSLHAGLAVTGNGGGVFIFLGDMPLIPDSVPALLAENLGEGFAVVPTFGGEPGHPVLLSARAAAAAAKLSGDRGAGALLRANSEEVAYIETHDRRVVFDVDTEEDFNRLSQLGAQ